MDGSLLQSSKEELYTEPQQAWEKPCSTSDIKKELPSTQHRTDDIRSKPPCVSYGIHTYTHSLYTGLLTLKEWEKQMLRAHI